MEQLFSLQPFPSSKPQPALKIAGKMTRKAHRLAIYYQLTGNLTEIAIAPPSDRPSRKHQLWEDTCFEFFLGIKNSDRYWEFNLSPAGHWNVYRFDGYRQGMQEETAIKTLPFSLEQRSDSLELTLDIDLSKIIAIEQELEIAITAVLKYQNEEVTYWAITHKGAEADFHRRDNFISIMPELPPLNINTIWAILKEQINDATVNQLVWYYLGYRYDESTQQWDSRQVPQEWRQEYPQPPDFIANRPPTVKLTRSIAPKNKQLLKEKLGFQGYKIGEFGPRQTRRATAANWLLEKMNDGKKGVGSGE